MHLGRLLVLSLFVGCTSAPQLDDPEPNQNPGNNVVPPVPDPDPKRKPGPDPEPEPAFQLVDGWYEGEIEVDIHVDNPIRIAGSDTEINTRCDGYAFFEVQGEVITNGYWECLLPGNDVSFDNIGAILGVVTNWQGSLLRFLWGTYDEFQCTGELGDGRCSLKGLIERGRFDYDTGQVIIPITIKSSRQGPLQDLAQSTGTQFIVDFITSFGSAPFTIDRENTATGGFVAEDIVRVQWDDDTNTTDFDWELDGEWYSTAPPPYDVVSLTQGL